MFSKNYFFRSPKDIVIKVGNADKSKLYKEYKAEKLIINGCYTTSENNDDIALIKSESVIVMEDSDNGELIVGSICLPNKDSDPARTDAIISGWGVWDEKYVRNSPKILQKANITIISEMIYQILCLFNNIGCFGFWKEETKHCIKQTRNTACYVSFGNFSNNFNSYEYNAFY